MPVLDINRYIARIRGLPGRNFEALALQEIQNVVNQIKPGVSPAAGPVSVTSVASGGGGSSTSPSTPSVILKINGLGLTVPVSFNDALPPPPAGFLDVKWLIDSSIPVPNVSAYVPSVGGVNTQSGASYTVQASDSGMLIALTNAASVAVTLPVATSLQAGFFCAIESYGAAGAVLTPTTSTIDGLTSLAIIQNQGVYVFSDGTNYRTFRGLAPTLGLVASIKTVTTTYTLLATDGAILADATGGAFTITLDTTNCIAGRRYPIKRINSGGNAVTYAPSSGNVDGAASGTLASQYAAVDLVTDNTNWWIF